MKLTKLVDDELIFFLTLQEDGSDALLKRRYESKFNYLVNRYSKICGNSSFVSKDSLYNVCLSTLIRAMEKRSDDNFSITAYWNTITIHEIDKIVEKVGKDKESQSLRIDNFIDKDGSRLFLDNVIGIPNDFSSKQRYYDAIEIVKKPSFAMDNDEKEILLKYLTGYTVIEIANDLPTFNRSAVYRIVKKGIRKLKYKMMK